MQRSSSKNNKKRTTNQNAQNTEKAEKNKVQNLKDFKLEIDHEIAKCLDTLDRQGLKYLRQTLKTSAIFAIEQQSNTIHKNIKKEIQIPKEDNQYEGIQQKDKVVKKIDERKKKDSTQIKTKKSNTPQKKKVKKTSVEAKKKSDSHANIKKNNNNMVEKPEKIIEEQIVEQCIGSSSESQGQNSSAKNPDVTRLGPNDNKPIKQQIPQTIKISPSKYKPSDALVEPIRPFSKNAQRKSALNVKKQGIEKKQPYIKPIKNVQNNKRSEQQNYQGLGDEFVNKKQIDIIVQKIINLPEDKLKKLGKIIQRLQNAQDEIFNYSTHKPYISTPNQSQIKSSMIKSGAMSSRIKKPNEKATSLYQSIMKGKSNHNLYQKDTGKLIKKQEQQPSRQIIIKGEENDQDIVEDIDQNQYNLEPQRQLSIRENQKNKLISNVSEPATQMSMEVSQIKKPTKNIETNINDDAKNEENKIKIEQNSKKNNFTKKFSSSIFKKPLDIDITESHQVQTIDLQQEIQKQKQAKKIKIQNPIIQQNQSSHQNLIITNENEQLKIDESINQNKMRSNSSRMMKLGKKKLGTNKIQIMLIKNRGHSTIIGLTGIQFYNIHSKVIEITLENIKYPSSSKMMKLFNGNNLTINEEQMYTAKINDKNCGEFYEHRLELQIPEKIAGVKIWNFNKSQIQSNKQTDQLQIRINDKLTWSGSIKKGSYNQLHDYATQIILDNTFQFPTTSNSQFHNSSSVLMNIKIKSDEEKKKQSPLKGKDKADSKKVADWLQTTIHEKKLKQLQSDNSSKDKIKVEEHIQEEKKQLPIFKNDRIEQSSLGISDIGFEPRKKIQNKNIQLKAPNQEISQAQIQEALKNKSRTQQNKLKIKSNNKNEKISQEIDVFDSIANLVMDKKSVVIHEKIEEVKQKDIYRKDNYQQKIDQEQQQYKNRIQSDYKKSSPEKYQEMRPSIVKPKTHEKNLQDFMNDSIFQDPIQPISKQSNRTKKTTPKQQTPYINNRQPTVNLNSNPPKNIKKDDLDLSQFIHELDDLVGGSNKNKNNKYQYGSQQSIKIPQLPKGGNLDIIVESNWGDSQNIGIYGIQFFDSNGKQVYPSGIKNVADIKKILATNSAPPTFLFKNSQQKNCQKTSSQLLINKQNIPFQICLQFGRPIEFSLIRICNYLGDRVHTSIGARKIVIQLDSAIIFAGEIKKASGSSPKDYHNYQSILFTNNKAIHRKILDNDWLRIQQQNKEAGLKNQQHLFKKTLQRFHKPATNGKSSTKILKIIENNQAVKIPKRQCFEYDPPSLPAGYFLKIVMHNTWGDQNFIGLNGIAMFDQKGEQIKIQKNKVKIKQYPQTLSSLPQNTQDKRAASNLFNGINFSENQEDIWLAPYVCDIDKMEKKLSNTILIEFQSHIRISAINFYNYMKNVKRGVRQLEIFVDHYCIYRGYIKMANENLDNFDQKSDIQTHSSISFTKDTDLLNKIGFMGYHEDNLQQHVAFINQGRQLN